MITAIPIISYNKNFIGNTKYVWHISEYFVIFHWNMFPAAVVLNGSLAYL